MAEKPKKKCLGRFETTYMKTMTAPAASDYAPKTRDHGQYVKVLNNLEMNKKFQFPTGLPKYRYDFCKEKYPVPGQKKKPPRPPVNYKPSCPQYAPYHSIMQDMSLIQRRLDTEPEHKHTWYRDKKDSIQMKKLGQIKEQLDSLKQLFAEERSKCHDLELQLERLRGGRKARKEDGSRRNTPRLNEQPLKSSEAEKVLTWLTGFDEGGGDAEKAEKPRSPRRTWAFKEVGLPPYTSKEKVMQDWISFQQGEKETISDYSERFWKLRLDMQAVQSLSNEEQLRRFVAGLKFKIRNEVVALRPSSLSDAIALAEMAETRLPLKGRPMKTKSRKLPKKVSKFAEPPRKKLPQIQLLSPAEQIKYLTLHGACACKKEKDDSSGDRK